MVDIMEHKYKEYADITMERRWEYANINTDIINSFTGYIKTAGRIISEQEACFTKEKLLFVASKLARG